MSSYLAGRFYLELQKKFLRCMDFMKELNA